MTTDSPGILTSLRRIVGLALIIAAPTLSLATWYSTREPLARLAWSDQHRAPGDSAGYAHNFNHAAYVRAINARRWHPTGYATLGLVGTLVGGLLLTLPRRNLAPA